MSDAIHEMITAQQKVHELCHANAKLRRAMAWLYGAYKAEAAVPLEALENSLIHLPVIEEAVRERA